jgi:hypothetical protein
MEIVRIPKGPHGSTVALLVIKSYRPEGPVQAELTITRPMQSNGTMNEYTSAAEAISASEAVARQNGASVFIIDDQS